ncbi:MAG: FAD:protein FMN transferase, partial [Gemmataceae bacterium]|nr:FAD:protein FMN transferase [Gemmataceae bacterium]
YRPDSEVAHLNARAGREWVQVEPALFRLLERAKELSAATRGAFDITIGPLMRCWGFVGGRGKRPSRKALAAARQVVGTHLIELDAEGFRVHYARVGVMIDLGAIGKGYAIENAVELLRAAGVTSGIIHGGTSTVYGIGKPPDAEAWRVAVEAAPAKPEGDPELVEIVELRDAALSVSAVWGKSFQSQGKTLGHIIDPRTGCPAENADLAAVVSNSPTDSDALSTALLTVGVRGLKQIYALRNGWRALVMKRVRGKAKTWKSG